jgi:hypothetical protein
MLEQLIEQARDLYDWIASCGQRAARFPAKELLAHVDCRGHSLYFRLQEPVLDKSVIICDDQQQCRLRFLDFRALCIRRFAADESDVTEVRIEAYGRR